MSLRIKRLRVEQLRRFRRPLELADFEPGLNIIAGPNEAGKSTLVRAIRAAFFERYRSAAVDDLRPWGEGSGAAPQIELDFELDGQPHRLVKSFLGKKRCLLQIGTRTLDGGDAEDHLAQLFGFAFAAKGASKPEHWGIPGLLWVEQGSAQQLDVGHAREHLHDALRGQVDASAGALAASGGDELLEQLRAQRGELLTGTGKPRGDYAEVAARVETLQAELAALDAQIDAYRQQVDQLAALRREHQDDEAAQPWQQLGQQLAEAEERLKSLHKSQELLQADQQQLDRLDDTQGLLLQELQRFERQQTEALARAQAFDGAGQAQQAAEAAAAAAREQAEAAQQRTAAARETHRRVRLQADRLGLQQQLQSAEADAARHADDLQRAERADQDLAGLRAETATAPAIGQAELDRLLKLERAERDAALRRQAVATRLNFALPPDQRIELHTRDTQRVLQERGEHLLDAPATLQLPGGGRLMITPGGTDLAELARTHERALDALQRALQALAVDDVEQARAQRAAVVERESVIKLAEQKLAIVAPNGLQPLRAALAQAQQRIGAARQALARLPAEPLPGGSGPQAPDPPLDEAEVRLDAAEAAERQCLAALHEAQRGHTAAGALLDSARREHAAAQAALSDPAARQRQAQTQQQLLANRAEREALAARIAQARAALNEARPDIVEQDIVRLRRSIDQTTRQHQQRRERIMLLENSLQQAGAQGLEEQRQAQAGQLERAQRRHEQLRRRADALDLLCGKLQDKRRATLARLQAPLQQRLQHYLPLLLPGASMQIDADLAPEALIRPAPDGNPESGQVQALSFGAREQLGLVSRFAYADLLQQAGRPTLLILDDALVHSDAQRLAQMKRVLFDAAQRHQVLLFTCHPEDWRDMGVPIRSLETQA
ncbi:MAG: AAA family ATPase [Burkholderiales bacterium]|nr:AAA family ATPase [Burkholderiales bacterium]